MDQRRDMPAPPARQPTQAAFWLAVIFGNFAVILLLAGGVSAALTARFIHASAPGLAQVVSTQPFPFRGKPVHDTVFTLVTPEGRRLSATWRSVEYYAPGQTVAVLYRAEPTIRIYPVEREGLWEVSWALLGLGIGFGAFAAMAYLRHRLRRRRASAS